MTRSGDTLLQIYRAAHGCFGHQGWWPGQTPLEVCVGAILTQNTNWTNVEKAIANLRAAGAMSIARLHELSHDELAALIRPAGYFNIKARRLRNFIAAVHARSGEDLEAFLARPAGVLREELLAISGVGRETADSIILYAARQATFVVDAYTYRILLRHGVISPEDDYEAIKDFIESDLPTPADEAAKLDLYNDFHAQFVATGKTYCRPAARCAGCPLEHLPHDARLASRAAEE